MGPGIKESMRAVGCLAFAFSLSGYSAGNAASPSVTAQQCEALATMQLPNIKLSQVTATTTGSFVPPDATAAVDAPPFCRVAGVASPTNDSVIRFEVWLPLNGWNGKLNTGGNGGFGRGFVLPTGFMLPALRRGYAVTGTDMGHPITVGYDASWSYGHPEKLVDWAYRANHETTAVAKALVKALYGRETERSYFTGCSDGGREALMQAQRYPGDYHGIIAGAAANNWSKQSVAHIWQARAMLDSALTAQKLPMIAKAAVAACDANDGVVDGVVETPQLCKFDPAILACPAGTDSATCLTAPQVDAVRKIYSGPVNPRTGAVIHPGQEPGSEALWTFQIAPNAVGGIGTDFFRYIVYGDPSWDFKKFDFDRDVMAAATAALVIDSTSPNLDAFRGNGGKLIMYHGLLDQAIFPKNSADYFNSVAARLAGGADEAREFLRLFYVPGMPHCFGGAGVDTFDALSALEDWVERATPPERIVGAHTGLQAVGANIMTPPSGAVTRPLCPYPRVAKFKGQGNTNDADNFTCSPP